MHKQFSAGWIFAAALTVAVFTSGPAKGQTPAARNLGSFRADLTEFLKGMREVTQILDESPVARSLTRQTGRDKLTESLTAAVAAVPYLSDRELTPLYDAFQSQSDWQVAPNHLRALFTDEVRARLKALPADAAKMQPADGGSGPRLAVNGAACDPGPGTPMGITDVYIAKGVSLGLNGVMEGFPTDGLTIAARLAPVAAWAVAEAAVLTLEGLNAVEAECLAAKFEDFIRDNLDAKVSTRATQASVNGAQTAINNVQTSVNGIQTSITNGFSASQTNLALLQASVNAAQTSINNVQTAITTLQSSVNAFQALDLRLKIEANLALPYEGTRTPVGNPARVVALFYLPAAQGGYLALARTIVEETIQKTAASGEPVGAAQARFVSADEAIGRRQFKLAYQLLGQAYREATQSY